MENAACALAAQTKFNRSNFQGKIIIVETVTPTANIPPTRPSQPVSKPQTNTPAVSQEAKTSTSSDPKPANNSDVSSKAAVVQVAKESSVTEKSEGKKPAEKETKVAQASKELEKRSSPKATTKKDSDSQKVPIKAPETSKSSSRASDSKQSTRRDSYKSKGRIQTKQGSSRSSHRDSTISNSINARRSGNYPRSRNLKESRDDYRSARSGGRFADRGKGHQTVHLSSRRNFPESGFSRPIITTSSEALYNQQHEILRMRQDAERMQMQRQREAALEKQRKDMEVELEKAKIDREKLRLEHERDRLEMEKLKFALRQAREHGQTRESEFRAKKASGSVKYAPKSTNSNNRSRDYSSKEKRRSPPRAEAYRSNTSSQRRPSRSRSPHRMSSSVRERKPESYYGNPSHKSSSRSRPEEPPRSSSHRATNQTVQLVNYHPSSSSRSAAHVQQPAAVSGYSSLSSHSGAASNQHHSRIDQQTSKDALYEKRLNELYRGNDSSYGRPVDNYGSSSYGRTATTDSRYQSNALSGNYNRSSGSSYDQSYPQNYSSSTSTQQHSSWPASGSALPYDTQVSNWRNAPGLDYPNIAASSYATERQSDMYQRRF
ncbi:hypothetical protein M3Y97_00424300 [Aphelenchoides bicaudatus]|nr:hypothetical protein M3Y97_00424300 [Aphelenchoides bicaudatus]